MKARNTSPGRLYALSSELGCVAINGAMVVDIPAGGLVHTKDNKLIAEIPIGGSVKLVAPRQQLDVTDPNAV